MERRGTGMDWMGTPKKAKKTVETKEGSHWILTSKIKKVSTVRGAHN